MSWRVGGVVRTTAEVERERTNRLRQKGQESDLTLPYLTLPYLTLPYLTLPYLTSVSYTHLRAHETLMNLVCRLLLEKKRQSKKKLIKAVQKKIA